MLTRHVAPSCALQKNEEDAWLEGVEVDERHAEKCRRDAEAEASKPEARAHTLPAAAQPHVDAQCTHAPRRS